MIHNISIENYRCFHKTEIKGFRLLNLIGGINNAGKTTLLEAIYLGVMPNKAYYDITNWREEQGELPTNLFFERNMKDVIIQFDDVTVFEIKEEEEEYSNFSIRTLPSITFNKMGAVDKQLQVRGWLTRPVYFMPSRNEFLSNREVSKLYSLARNKDSQNISYLIEAFKSIESKFELTEILLDNDNPILYLKKISEQTRPLKMYGDAMNRVAEFILRIVLNPNGILLIDEIENGIHYQTQPKIWKILFTLAIKHNVQIFATSHSLEMIRAFNEVAAQKEEFEQNAMYFEMSRHAKTTEIIGHPINMEMLRYEITKNQPFRGE